MGFYSPSPGGEVVNDFGTPALLALAVSGFMQETKPSPITKRSQPIRQLARPFNAAFSRCQIGPENRSQRHFLTRQTGASESANRKNPREKDRLNPPPIKLNQGQPSHFLARNPSRPASDGPQGIRFMHSLPEPIPHFPVETSLNG
jgi:hypothetical protein